jgi:hypothetical protein
MNIEYYYAFIDRECEKLVRDRNANLRLMNHYWRTFEAQHPKAQLNRGTFDRVFNDLVTHEYPELAITRTPDGTWALTKNGLSPGQPKAPGVYVAGAIFAVMMLATIVVTQWG